MNRTNETPFGRPRRPRLLPSLVHWRTRWRDESGSATVESVLWLPVFLAVLGIVVDGTIMFTNRSMAMKVVQDANRSFAIGRLTTPVETQDYILTRLRPMSPSVTAQTSVDKGVILTRVTMPAEEIDAIGLFGLLTGFKVGFQAQHMAEN